MILEWLAGMKQEEEAAHQLGNLERRVGPMARLELNPRTRLLLRGILAGEGRAETLRCARSEFPGDEPGRLEREIDELGERIGRMPLLRPFLTRWRQRAGSLQPR